MVVFAPTTFADYADGGRTEQAMTLPDAVKVWRQEAWQRDDFLAQVRLGDLYSGSQSIAPGESKNPSFADPVEAYVWYFMALRPFRDYRADDNSNAADTIYSVRNNALNNAEHIYNSMTFEQRLDARARILYILSSRGAEGFLTLGRIHSSDVYPAPPSQKPFILVCRQSFWARNSWDYWFPRLIRWIVSSVWSPAHDRMPYWNWVRVEAVDWKHVYTDRACDGMPVPPEPQENVAQGWGGNGMGAANQGWGGNGAIAGNQAGAGNGVVALNGDGAGRQMAGAAIGASPNVQIAGQGGNGVALINAGGGNNGGGFGGGGYYGMRSVSSVFVANDAEALTYFLIAQSLGHPLAGAYVANERGAIRYNNGDPGRIIADAEKRARFWMAPYEYYPGTTSTGDLHSDESLLSFEQRAALARFREIPLPAIVAALDFRGYRMNPRLCGPLPVCLHNAVTQFQTALKWDPTGWLSPIQMVRLIQMTAVDGDAIAQDRLGIMYAKGIGVPQNFVKAEKWFIKSANQRYPDALFNLSVLYRVGPNGIDPDENKSNSYRQIAERAGYAQARCELLYLMADATGHDRPEGARR